MADALASGASGSNTVWVQVPSPAFFFLGMLILSAFFFSFWCFQIMIQFVRMETMVSCIKNVRKRLHTMKLREITYISLCAIILAVCSWITIPSVVPFTLGTFGVYLVTLILGGKRGTIAVAIYILLGMMGIPVFSGFRGGAAVLLGTTGGYIIGYIFMSLVMWSLEKWTVKNKWMRIFSMALGLVLCYICGTIWFMITYAKNTGSVGVMAVLSWCVLPYIIPDLIKMGLAFILSKKIKTIVKIK